MLRIPCPFCGEREEDEFVYGGDAARTRPADPDNISDLEWGDYLYNANNTKGVTREWWWHANGCTKWFVVERNTITHAISSPARNTPWAD